MRRHSLIKLILLVLTPSLPWQAQAILEIRITHGVEGALPIAIAPFAWQGREGLAAAPEDIAAVVTADLVRSGQFAATPESEFPQAAVMGKPIYFKSWRGREVDYLVVGRPITGAEDPAAAAARIIEEM